MGMHSYGIFSTGADLQGMQKIFSNSGSRPVTVFHKIYINNVNYFSPTEIIFPVEVLIIARFLFRTSANTSGGALRPMSWSNGDCIIGFLDHLAAFLVCILYIKETNCCCCCCTIIR